MLRVIFIISISFSLLFFSCGGASLVNLAQKGDSIRVKDLIEKGADVNTRGGEYKSTALIEAAKRGHKDIVRLLIDSGADVNARALEGPPMNALRASILNKHRDIFEMLFDAGGRSNEFILIDAAKLGSISVINDLITHFDSLRTQEFNYKIVNLKDQSGRTALMWAASKGYSDIVKVLLQNDAETNVQEKVKRLKGGTYKEKSQGSYRMYQYEVTDASDGHNALTLAIKMADVKSVQLLLVDSGVDPNFVFVIEELEFQSPFSVAATLDMLKETQWSNIRPIKEKESTPLIMAVSTNQIEMVKLLLENGADINLKPKGGRSAIETAKRDALTHIKTLAASFDRIIRILQTYATK